MTQAGRCMLACKCLDLQLDVMYTVLKLKF